MSEPTSGSNQPPDPDQAQDESAGSVFNDPTAPVWVEPTAPIPAPPPPPAPPGAATPQDQQPAVSPPPPPAPPGNPYAQQPAAQPYGQQYPAYGQQYPAYGQQYPAYGQQYPAYPSGPPTQANSSAIVLTILSGISVLVCNILAIGSLVFGIVALTKNSADPEGSRRMTKIGWIVFAAVWAVGILGIIAYIIFVAAIVGTSSSTNFNSNF